MQPTSEFCKSWCSKARMRSTSFRGRRGTLQRVRENSFSHSLVEPSTAECSQPASSARAGVQRRGREARLLGGGGERYRGCVRTRFRTVWWNQAQRNAAPEGRPSLAQRFSAGESYSVDFGRGAQQGARPPEGPNPVGAETLLCLAKG